MSIDRQRAADVTILKVSGDLSGMNAEQLRSTARECIDQGQRDFIIDLEGVQTCDSIGLEALTWMLRECEERLGLVRLTGVGNTVRRILEITRLIHRFAAHDETF